MSRLPGRVEAGDPARSPLSELPGVGPARTRALARLGLGSVRDLLFFVPRGVEERGERVPIRAAGASIGRRVSVVGRLRGVRLLRRGGRRSVLSATLEDGSGSLGVLYFNQPWLLDRLRSAERSGEELEFQGRVVRTRRGAALASPRLGPAAPPRTGGGGLVCIYSLTEGVGQALLARLARTAVERFARTLADPLAPEDLAALDLPPLARAVRDLHAPPDLPSFERARARIGFERLLVLQARLERSRVEAARGRARAFPLDGGARKRWRAALPFSPTAAQGKAIEELADDLARTRPMRRLLQGDVGSGKTMVALFALAAVSSAGGQAAFLAPTEILAEQHALCLAPWLARFDLEPVLLTGSLASAARRRALESLARGRRRIAIGTHALFAEEVRFQRLDLVVIDEQQRFGVAQKQALLEKGKDVHALLMTATPIPRTLALCLYGDLETSVLDEKPLGRGRVETIVLPRARRGEALRALANRLERGERGFVVYPRIGETGEPGGEDAQAAAVETAGRALARGGFERYGVELLHGRLSSPERVARLERFRSGASRLLVGTSMIEVGIDVPEATLLIVEGAERFGLAQLHQLRGRVGRGAGDAQCFLLGGSEDAERLAILERTEDGFAIAEEDLRRRGMGDLAGARQAGENLEGLALPWVDAERVLRARALVRADPALAARCLAGNGAGSVAVV